MAELKKSDTKIELEKDLQKLQIFMEPLKKFIEVESTSFFRSFRIYTKQSNLTVTSSEHNFSLIYKLEIYFSRAFGIFKKRVSTIVVELRCDESGKFQSASIDYIFNQRISEESFFSGSYESGAPYRLKKRGERIHYNERIVAGLNSYKNKISKEFKIPLNKVEFYNR